jgi:hypothetical protein
MLDGRQPVAGEGWGPGARARQRGGSWPGPAAPRVLDGRQPVAGEGGAPELARQLGIMAGARGALMLDGRQPVAGEGGAPPSPDPGR